MIKKGKNPAFLFFPGDWIRDPQLQMATFQTQGIWINILCRMWYAPERGKLSGTVQQICKLLSCTNEQFVQFLNEVNQLKFADVTNCNNDVMICNRRMIKEEKDRENNRKRVAKHRVKCESNENVTTPLSYSVSYSVTKKKENTKRKNDFTPTETEVYLCDLLKKKILENNPKAVVKNGTGWLKETRLMMTKDKRTLEDIERVINFSQNDSFWKANILSMGKLREKFDQLTLKMKGGIDDDSRYDFLDKV